MQESRPQTFAQSAGMLYLRRMYKRVTVKTATTYIFQGMVTGTRGKERRGRGRGGRMMQENAN